jgi:hypothetical protein
MYTLYDPLLTVEYTEDDLVIVYDDGLEIARDYAPGIETIPNLKAHAKDLAEARTPKVRYTSIADAARELGMTRQNIHVIIRTNLINGMHFIEASGSRLLTPRGWQLLKEKYKKD